MAADKDNFEDAIRDKSEETVADFDSHEKGIVGFIHETLHKYPFFVPLMGMVLAIIVFGVLNPNC